MGDLHQSAFDTQNGCITQIVLLNSYKLDLMKALIPTILLAIVTTGCIHNLDIETPIDNFPIVANAEDAYTFTVLGNEANINRQDNLNFSTDKVVASLTISNYGRGSGVLRITDANGEIIFEETLNGNKVVADAEITGKLPESIAIDMSDFSGHIVFAFSAQDE